jgi:outer membrane receptor protein involved in Fe transport
MRPRFVSFLKFMALVLVITAGALRAQVGTGSITGTVTDSTGAVVVGASVTVTNAQTGVAINLVSNSDGRYVAPDLNVGVYNIGVQAKGFKAEKHLGVELLVGRQMVVDFPLVPGQQSETVTVQGEASQVETTTSEISAQIGQSQMRDLPLNGRNYAQLILLAPGVQQVTSSQQSGFMGRVDAISVAGSRPEGEAYLLDGAEIHDFWNRSPGMGVTGETLGIDAIGEFQVLTNTYSAQFGGNGSVMNATTRSGTNQLHGSVYEYIRNSAVDAKNYFDLASTAIPAFRRNQFGATLGGPIKKDKSFVFMNYEGFRQLLGETMGVVVPDAQARLGYINGVNYNPPTAIMNIVDLYPAPPATATELGGGEARFSRVGYQPAREDYGITRWDYTLGQKDNLFVRYVIDDGILTEPFSEFPTPLGSFPETGPGRNQYLTIGERRLVSNALVNDATVSFVRTNSSARSSVESPYLEWYPGSGFQNGTVGVTGLATLGPDVVTPAVQIVDTYSASDDVVWTRGKHTLSFGLGFSRAQIHTGSSVFTNGSWSFDGMQQLLQDQPASFEGAVPGKSNSYRIFFETRLSPYVEEDWKVLPTLTLNLGLRYGWVSNPTEKNDYMCAFINPASPTTTGCTTVPNAFVSNPTKKAFDPRVGFSWDPFKDHKTAIRGGVGLFHDPIGVRVYNASYEFTSPGTVYVSKLQICGLPGAPPCNFPTPNPFITAVFVGNGVAYSSNTTPFPMQYNLGVQRQVGAGTVLNVAYIGSRGYNLLVRDDLNPPVPTTVNGAPNFGGASPSTGGIGSSGPRANTHLGALPFDLTDGSSWYNSLQIYLTRNVGKTVQFQVNYTYSKSIDTGSNSFGAEEYNSTDTQYNPYNLAIEKGLSSFDARNAFTANAVYSLPFQRNALVKGWEYSIIATAHSGNPFTVYDGFDRTDLGDPGGIGGDERPDLVPGKSNNPKVGKPTEWYDTSAFSLQYPGAIGDLGRNTLGGPSLVDFDMTLQKVTQLTERLGVQLRFDLFNVFNHPNFGNPDQALYAGPTDSPGGTVCAGGINCVSPEGLSYGVPNGDAGAIHNTVSSSRQMQLSVKLQF